MLLIVYRLASLGSFHSSNWFFRLIRCFIHSFRYCTIDSDLCAAFCAAMAVIDSRDWKPSGSVCATTNYSMDEWIGIYTKKASFLNRQTTRRESTEERDTLTRSHNGTMTTNWTWIVLSWRCGNLIFMATGPKGRWCMLRYPRRKSSGSRTAWLLVVLTMRLTIN
jgi:hypothetical protein